MVKRLMFAEQGSDLGLPWSCPRPWPAPGYTASEALGLASPRGRLLPAAPPACSQSGAVTVAVLSLCSWVQDSVTGDLGVLAGWVTW